MSITDVMSIMTETIGLHSARVNHSLKVTKPLRACDTAEDKIKFPCIIMPKIDGVRSVKFTEVLTARTLKKHKNVAITEKYSDPVFDGLDGEMAADVPTHPDLCRLTMSRTGTIKGSGEITWWIFDCVTDETSCLSYLERYQEAYSRVSLIKSLHGDKYDVRIVPALIVNNIEQLLVKEAEWLEEGYEGIVGRFVGAQHKNGRATERESWFWRIKRFVEEEAVITGITEAMTNNNEVTINELGNSTRSTHKENKTPKGMLGTMIGEVLKDIYFEDRLLFTKGQEITISPGSMTETEKIAAFLDPSLVVRKISKFKFFPKGVKDKPRFPNHVVFRDSTDFDGE